MQILIKSPIIVVIFSYFRFIILHFLSHMASFVPIVVLINIIDNIRIVILEY